jgi:tyrosine-protein kinase Etk/Wzc
MQQKNKSQEEAVITLSDLVHIFKTHRVAILFGALFCCLFAAGFSLSRPVLYNIEGTFKDKGKANAGMGGLSALLGGGSNQAEGEAMATIKSRKFMEKLIYRRGLQGVLIKQEPRFDLFGSIPENLKVEHALFWGFKHPVIPDHQPAIWLQEVAYDDELFKSLSLSFLTEEAYEVNHNGVLVGKGELGKKFTGEDFAFTVMRKSSEPLEGTNWTLQLQPLSHASDVLLNTTTVEADRYDKNLLHIKLAHTNRHIGAEVLNSMMLIYQEHIRQQQKRIAREQIAYLEIRQKEMGEKLRKMMEEHAKNMTADVSSSGFLNSARAIEFFSANQTMYQQKLYDIELAVKRLTKAQQETYAHYDGYGDTGIINHTLAEIRQLKLQSDTLDLALRKAFTEGNDPFHATFEDQLLGLEHVQRSYAEATSLLKSLNDHENVPVVDALMNNKDLAVKVWYDKLLIAQNSVDNALTANEKTSKKQELASIQGNFTDYIANLVHLFEVQERVIKERLAFQQSPQREFQGIDLQTSRELYISYNKMLNEVQSNIKQLDFMIEQLKNPEFEITSMSSIPNDFVTNEMVSKASQLVQSMKDQNNRSTNEITRLKDQLVVQKEFLLQHLKQAVSLQELREQLVKDKIVSLQSVTLGLLRQQISILDKNMQDYIGVRLRDLNQETDLIAAHQQNMRDEMKGLPNKWVEERLIDQQLMINQKMVQDIAGLVESKNMESNLEILQSYPQDFAIPPLHPKSNRSIIYAFFGAFAGAFLTFTYFIVMSALYGVRASIDNLRANHLHISGLIGPKAGSMKEALLDRDLDTMRRLIAYITAGNIPEQGRSLLLLNGAGVDYAPRLVELLAKRGLKVLWMPVSFKNGEAGQGKGLIQYLEGAVNDPEIVHEGVFDCIYEGGVSRYTAELIGSPRFKDLLGRLKAKYDWIVVSTDVMPTSGEADALVEQFDNAVANLTHENISELKSYMGYKMDSGEKKVSFVFSSSTG